MLLRNTRCIKRWDGLLVACRYVSTEYLTAGLKDLHKLQNQKEPSKPSRSKASIKEEFLKQSNLKGIKPYELTKAFLDDAYGAITPKQLSFSQTFWNNAKINLDYTIGSIDQIPDIKYEHLLEQRFRKIEENPQQNQHLIRSKKTFGIKPELLKPLPEVLFLGHTNAGKSSIINNIFSKKSDLSNEPLAFVSRRAGFTKTLNGFSISKKLRLIDSPGYGEFGEEKQGKAVLDYLATRNLLRRVFVVVDGKEGFRDEDLQIIDHLILNGIPFEIILTKVDLIISRIMGNTISSNKRGNLNKSQVIELVKQANSQIINYYQKMLTDANVLNIATLPKILFTNNSTNKYIQTCFGNRELRYNILQSCGLID